jgi:hypothetical protein
MEIEANALAAIELPSSQRSNTKLTTEDPRIIEEPQKKKTWREALNKPVLSNAPTERPSVTDPTPKHSPPASIPQSPSRPDRTKPQFLSPDV